MNTAAAQSGWSQRGSATRHAGGFALFDLLLAAAVAGLLIAGIMPFMSRATEDLGSKAIADQLNLFKAGAQAHFQANRAAYDAAMKDGTGAANLCKIGVNVTDGTGGTVANDTTLHTCAIDGTMLKYLQALSAGFPANNAYGEQWVVIYRQMWSGGQPTGSDEAFFASAAITSGGGAVAANDRRFHIAVNAGSAFGSGGGAVPDTDRGVCIAQRSSSTYQACGDGWKINLGDFVSSTQLTTFANRLTN